MTEKIYTNKFEKTYPKALNRIEKYAHYTLRCLHRCGIHPKPTDYGYLTFVRKNGTIAEALVYPITAIKDDTVENPLFFYGFKADFNFQDLDKPIEITFSEDFDELRN